MISTYYIKYYTKVVECSFDETFSFFSTYNTEPVIDTLYTRKVEGDDEDLLFVAAHVATKQSGERREVITIDPTEQRQTSKPGV